MENQVDILYIYIYIYIYVNILIFNLIDLKLQFKLILNSRPLFSPNK
jgi:hypothetical protein